MTQRKQSNKDPFVTPKTNLKLDSQGKSVEDAFDDVFDINSKEKGGFLKLCLDKKHLNKILLLFIAGLLILLFNAAYLQIVKGAYYRDLAEGNRIRIKTIKAQRGIIYDKNGLPLVKNVPSFSLFVIPNDLPKNENKRMDVLVKLAGIIMESPWDIEKELKEVEIGSLESYQPLVLKENISYEEAILLKIQSASLPGVNLETNIKRRYLNCDKNNLDKKVLSLSHLLGFEGKITAQELEEYEDEGYDISDRIGKTGLELFYEQELHGQDGKQEVEVDALGKKVKVLAKQEPKSGQNLRLTLDWEIQSEAEKILSENLKKQNKSKGSVIILNPKNGEILALVSLPSFDNNDFVSGISSEKYQELIDNSDRPLFNRSVSGEYPSGSTIKPIMAAAALQEGIINRNTTFKSTGGIRIKSWFFPDWKYGGHGPTNVTKAIAESVNTFFYIIGGGYEDFEGLELDKIVSYFKKFGIGDKLGLDLPSESRGFVPTREWKEEKKEELWYIGDTYHLSIGQGDILVTPLQVANYTAFFANNGYLYRPHIVKELFDSEGRLIKKKAPEVLNNGFIENKNIEIVKQGLRQAVTVGSARYLSSLPISSAGKTGTAQWGKDKTPHAWFTGFAPYDDPEIVVTVLVEEGGEGSAVSVPIAGEILNWYFTERGQEE